MSGTRKAQVSFIDVLLLGLFISLVLILGFTVGRNYMTSFVTKEESTYAKSMLVSLMNYRNTTYGDYNNTAGLTTAEAINLYFCTGKIGSRDLNESIKALLDDLVKPNYNYIFYTYGQSRQVWVWKGQKELCASYIPLRTFNLKLTCDIIDYKPPMLGIWPEWKDIPLTCENSTNPMV